MKSGMFKQITKSGLMLTAVLSAAACSPKSQSNETYQTQNNTNIIGGQLSDEKFQKEHGVVGLNLLIQDEKGKTNEATCTGTLIAPNIVITAAHCVAIQNLAGIAVYFTPEQNKIDEENVRFVVDFTIHKDYLTSEDEMDGGNDIALLKLHLPAPADVKLAQLPKSANEVKLSFLSKLTLTGFGITNAIVRKSVTDKKGEQHIVELGSVGSGVLRQVDNISIVSVTDDLKEFQINQTKGKGACHGDSGGPAFVTQADGTFLQVGLTSRSTEALGNCNKGAIYTSLLGQHDWIQENLAKLIARPMPSDDQPADAKEQDSAPVETAP